MPIAEDATLEPAGNGLYNLVAGLYKQTIKQTNYDEIMADQGAPAKKEVKEPKEPKDENKDPRVAELNALDKEVLLEMAKAVDESVKGTWGKPKLVEAILKAEKDEE
jgi:hypothetical protein